VESHPTTWQPKQCEQMSKRHHRH